MSKVYFKAGAFSVTSGMVRARTRSIQTSTIESVDVGRPFFWLALAGGAGLIGLVIPFGDLLYPAEIATLAGIGAGALAVTWPIGTLKVFSKLTGDKGWGVVGRVKTLRAMRDAIETALMEQGGKSAARASIMLDDSDG